VNIPLIDLLDGLEAVSAATLTAEGRLLEVRGFLATILPAGAAAGAFLEPSWPALKAAAGKRVEVTLAPSFRLGAVLRPVDGGFLLVVERPAEDLEEMSRATVRMANELANTRRELAESRRLLAERDEQARVLSFFDRITGLGNRRAFNQSLGSEILRAERYGGPLAVLMAAIDGLEGVDSHLGEEAVDDVLRCFATVVGHATRKTDIAFRLDRNRFVLLLTHTPSDRAAQVAERIRAAFASAAPGMVAADVTVSFGHADWRLEDDLPSLFSRVEAALEIAKGAGGNRVRTG
jgi:diguanylate cyclase (GGDEF)-like protein